MSRQQRDALRESFLRAYARNGKVAENAGFFSIRLCTAQGWVNRYIRMVAGFRMNMSAVAKSACAER